jgi:hypothetical protein
MDRQLRTGDTVLVNSREMTGRSQTLPWLLGEVGEGAKTTGGKYIGQVDSEVRRRTFQDRDCLVWEAKKQQKSN